MDGDLPCAVAGTDGADHYRSRNALSLCTVPACSAVALGQSGRSGRDGTMAGWLDGVLVLRRQSRILQPDLRRARNRDADADVVLSLGFCRPAWCRVECRTGAPDGSGYDGRTGAAGWPPRRGCGRYGCSAGMILTSLGRRPTVCSRLYPTREDQMAESVYKVIELIGTSTESWDAAGRAAVERAAQTLRDLRIAEVVEQDIQINNGKVEAYRVKLKVSFKYEKETD